MPRLLRLDVMHINNHKAAPVAGPFFRLVLQAFPCLPPTLASQLAVLRLGVVNSLHAPSSLLAGSIPVVMEINVEHDTGILSWHKAQLAHARYIMLSTNDVDPSTLTRKQDRLHYCLETLLAVLPNGTSLRLLLLPTSIKPSHLDQLRGSTKAMNNFLQRADARGIEVEWVSNEQDGQWMPGASSSPEWVFRLKRRHAKEVE
ncbi:hypothetical protein JCM8547_004156 [Rhodosporidiobolus lusitaniae]